MQVLEVTQFIRETSRNRLIRSSFFLVLALALPALIEMPVGGYVLAITVALVCIWRLIAAWPTFRFPERDPLVTRLRALPNRGEPADVVGPLHLSEHFVLHKSRFELELIFLSDIIWVYKKGAKSVVHERNGNALIVHLTEREMVKFCQLLTKYQPKIVFGYSAALFLAWQSQREAFIKKVDDARAK